MPRSSGKRWAVLTSGVILVGFIASVAYMLPGQLGRLFQEPRYIPVLAIACWKFETLEVLTLRQRLLWRYSVLLERNGSSLAVHFQPREPNTFTGEQTERRRRVWETHVLVDPHTLTVVRWYLAAD